MRACFVGLIALVPAVAAAQAVPAPPAAASAAPAIRALPPIDASERMRWIVDGIVGPRSLGVGVVASAWQTGWNTPEEWGAGWSGFGRRYAEREADVAISNGIEGGLGAIWGEDPRYAPSRRRGLWPRVRYAMKTVVLAPRRDGHLAPAWGRFAGNVFNNVIENAWLPPSATTAGQTTLRSVNGLVGRLAGNLYEEFWPDVHRRLAR